jgi:hypothetical protein
MGCFSVQVNVSMPPPVEPPVWSPLATTFVPVGTVTSNVNVALSLGWSFDA